MGGIELVEFLQAIVVAIGCIGLCTKLDLRISPRLFLAMTG